MKLSSLFTGIAKAVQQAARMQRLQEQQRVAKAQVVQKSDAFEQVKKAPVNLGKIPGASAAGDEAYVKSLYQELLGRDSDPEGLKSHLNGLANGMSRDEIRQVFLSSPEFREKQAAEAAGAAAQTGTGQAQGLGLQGVGPVPLEGYDAGKLADLNHKTVKYLFGRVASHFPLDSVKDKASAEALLKRMVPELEASGLKIHEVKGDKIRVDTPLGQEWVDVVRGSGSGNPGWWWGSEGKAIPGTEGTGVVASGGAGTVPAPGTAQPANYANIPGFNLDKIKDPTHVNDKYSPALRAFSAAIGTLGLPPGTQSLQAIADYARQHGFPDARVAGKDLLDFGDGKGPIDVITDVGGPNQNWWFHNQEGDGSPVNPPGTGLPNTSVPGTTTTPGPGPVGTPGQPGAPLSTIPPSPEYATAPIDKSSPSAAVLSAARWAKATYPDLFRQAASNDQSGRNACMQIMTKVIGAMRAAGFDATRVVNHPDRAMTDGYRYGSDALALNGRVYDCFADMGGASTPAANDVGEYTSDRLRE